MFYFQYLAKMQRVSIVWDINYVEYHEITLFLGPWFVDDSFF